VKSLRGALALGLLLHALLLSAVPVSASASCETALLVIDVQVWFLDWHSWVTVSGEEIVPAISRLLEPARDAEIPVIYIRDLSLDRRGDGDHLQIHQDIAPLEGDAVFTKFEGDALSNPDLVAHLEESGIERLLISGIASDGCVQATFRSAYRAGYEIIIITDAHAHSDGTVLATEAMNRTWLGWGLEGHPMDEIDWLALACLDDTADSKDVQTAPATP